MSAAHTDALTVYFPKTAVIHTGKLEVIKHCKCLINYRFGSTFVHVHRAKPRKDISGDTWVGKPTEVPIKAEGTGPRRAVDLLPTEEEKLIDHDLNLLQFMSDRKMQRSAILEKSPKR